MKKNIIKNRFMSIFIGLFLVTFSSFGQARKDLKFEINGAIKGLKSDSVFMVIFSENKATKLDTLSTKAVNGKFRFKGRAGNNINQRGSILFKNIGSRKNISVYTEAGKISIKGNINDLDNVEISGTSNNNDLTKAQRYLAPMYDRRSILMAEIRKSVAQSNEPAQRGPEMKKLSDSIKNFKVKFMEDHPSSALSLDYLYVLQDDLPTENIDRIFNNFAPQLQKSSTGKYIYEKLQAAKSVAVGRKAPDFTSLDVNGNKVSLNDFKGKYVLIEFWASWCVPCRAQNPEWVRIYDRFKDKNFTILQYSVDVKKDEQKWKDAIKKDGLVWTQVANIQGTGTNVTQLYGVQPIPDNFLIAPDGTILGRRLHPKEVEEQLQKLLQL